MKQHITIEQWRDLPDKAQKKLQEWWGLRTPPLLSIGQMIEFLDEQDDYFKCWYRKGDSTESKTNRSINWEYGEELCDALWEAVKEVLEK